MRPGWIATTQSRVTTVGEVILWTCYVNLRSIAKYWHKQNKFPIIQIWIEVNVLYTESYLTIPKSSPLKILMVHREVS